MIPPDVDGVMVYAASLWKKWEPGDGEAALWKKVLGYSRATYRQACDALDECKKDSRINSPNVRDYERHVGGFLPQVDRQDTKQIGATDWWIVSEDYSDCRQIVFATQKDIPDEDKLAAIAERMRQSHEENILSRGRKYKALRDTTWTQVEEQKRCYREAHGLPVTGQLTAKGLEIPSYQALDAKGQPQPYDPEAPNYPKLAAEMKRKLQANKRRSDD